MRRLAAIAVAVAAAACGSEPPPPGADAAVEPDPLAVDTAAEPGSLDDLYDRIIERRCSGQPGLCHNGQFEPNLSTAGLTYAYLVNRPSIEKPAQLRVRPGSAATSVFIDKLRNRNSVATQMPLGAEPLDEADIAALEKWIDDGALRVPGGAAAPVLNNPPRRPQIAVYSGTQRLDGAGPVQVARGATITLRHTVHDFETPDAQIPFAAVILTLPDGRNVVLVPGADDPHLAPTAYDAGGPPGYGDLLNYQRAWTVPQTLDVCAQCGQPGQTLATVPAQGQALGIAVVYVDEIDLVSGQLGIVAFDFAPYTIQVQ